MAIDFDGTGDFLSSAGVPITGYPFSAGCFFRVDNVTGTHTLISFFSATGEHTLRVRGAVAGDPLSYVANDGGTNQNSSVNGVTANTWHFGAMVGRSDVDRDVYLNTSKGGNAVSRLPVVDTTQLGASSGTSLQAGHLAHVWVYDVALNDDELAILAKGVHPFLVRPQNLVAYWPLVRDPYNDEVGGLTLTINGNPTVAGHPPAVGWFPYRIGGKFKIAAGGVSVSPSSADAAGAVVAPTVILGSLSIAPAVVSAAGAVVAPTIVAGSLTIAPAEVVAAGITIDPTVLDAFAFEPDPASAVGDVVAPDVEISDLTGVTVEPGAAEAKGEVVDPTTVLGSISLTPTPAEAVGEADIEAVEIGLGWKFGTQAPLSGVWTPDAPPPYSPYN